MFKKEFILGLILTTVTACFFNLKFLYRKLHSAPDNIPEARNYSKVEFNNIDWHKDKNILDFIPAFLDSCRIIHSHKKSFHITEYPYVTTAQDWDGVCRLFKKKNFQSALKLRAFLQKNFLVYQLGRKDQSLITGYYRLELKGKLVPDEKYRFPIYKTPNDIITVNLQEFNKDLPLETIVGRVKDHKVIPYYNRAEINNGALDESLVLLWLSSPYKAFLLHVQGSGVVELQDEGLNKKKVFLVYNGRNGFQFKPISKLLSTYNLNMTNPNQIDEFFQKNPTKINEILSQNPLYIFFKEVDITNWNAAYGTLPRAERTVAVDKRFTPLGVPMWVDLTNPANHEPTGRLVVANDVGSAIKGVGRVDFYWGLGKQAREQAIHTKQNQTTYMLLLKPKLRSENPN